MIKRILPSIFKVSLLGFLLIGFTSRVSSQTVSTPIGGYSGNIVIGQDVYHAIESIYLNAEIGTSNFNTAGNEINNIAYSLTDQVGQVGTLPVTVPQFKVYMKNVAASTTTFSTGTYSLTGYTLVYDGVTDYTLNAVGWNGFNLTTPFLRTANSNLQVLILRQNAATVPGFIFDASVGNSASSTNNSARRYNGATASTTLTATVYRPTIQIAHLPSTDVTAYDITSPVSSCYTSNQSVTVTIKNTGLTNSIGAGAVAVKLNVTGANTYTVTKNSVAAIALGDTQTIIFDNIPLTNVGSNTIKAITTLTGDGNAKNDTITTGATHTSTITTFPLNEGAEAPLTAFKYLKGLTQTASDWYRLTVKYGNKDLSDSITPHGGSAYYLYNSYGASSGSAGILYSDCVTFPSGSSSSISFYMTHDTSWSSFHDSIFVAVSTDKGATWNLLNGFDRVDASYTTLDYGQHTVDLSAYAGQTVQVALLGLSEFGNSIGVDDISINAILPVKLVSFTGTREGSKNILNWVTATETNSKGFELQRSANGSEFTAITFVKSTSNNGVGANYVYTDEKPLAGTNYYRLRQIDNDGKATLSNVVVLKSAQIKAEISRVFPNPVQDKLNIVLNTIGAEKVTVSITDLAGRIISSKSMETVQGDNNISFNTAALAKGTYLIKVNSSSNSELATQKFVKP